jgi:hypothetical protein
MPLAKKDWLQQLHFNLIGKGCMPVRVNMLNPKGKEIRLGRYANETYTSSDLQCSHLQNKCSSIGCLNIFILDNSLVT